MNVEDLSEFRKLRDLLRCEGLPEDVCESEARRAVALRRWARRRAFALPVISAEMAADTALAVRGIRTKQVHYAAPGTVQKAPELYRYV